MSVGGWREMGTETKNRETLDNMMITQSTQLTKQNEQQSTILCTQHVCNISRGFSLSTGGFLTSTSHLK